MPDSRWLADESLLGPGRLLRLAPHVDGLNISCSKTGRLREPC